MFVDVLHMVNATWELVWIAIPSYTNLENHSASLINHIPELGTGTKPVCTSSQVM